MLGLEPRQYQLLESLALKPLLDHQFKVWVFGSRARGTHHKFSDVDLLIEAPSDDVRLRRLISRIRDDLEDSNLAVKVDIVDVADLAESYRNSVFADRQAINLSRSSAF